MIHDDNNFQSMLRDYLNTASVTRTSVTVTQSSTLTPLLKVLREKVG